jgi:hypothetical protein
LGAEFAGVVGSFVQGVADQPLERVDPLWWAGPGNAITHRKFPDAKVDQGVVVSADEGESVDVRSSSVTPPLNVVSLAPFGW